jgi:sirohydrochlorin ferrochelatase
MKAILLIDHGSRRAEANEMLYCMANLVQTMAGPDVIVRPSHMELTEPTVAQGFSSCVAAGATEVIAFPYMLSPGRHSIEHIPEMVAEAAQGHPGVAFSVTSAFGVHEKLAELILDRAKIAVAQWPAGASETSDCCWHPTSVEGTCGDACRASQEAAPPSLAVHGR